ncbi:hypothetical protein CDIK_2232 [Cucumispora dikerogammari]|nr:hypothetical protein CDIK_2232 [Cucumispora dikerogammari]
MFIPYFLSHPDYILIMNKCRFHNWVNVLNLLQENNILFKFIRPFTPHLNPIEEFFSKLKVNYRALRPVAITRLKIKSRMISLLSVRVGNFLRQLGKAFALLPRAIARHKFL